MLLFLILLVSPVGAQEKFSLSFRYQAGETYRYKGVNAYDMSQEMNGQEMKLSGSVNNMMQLFTESVDKDGNITFILTLEEIKATMKNAMFDTIIEPKDMIGKKTRLIMDKYGKETSREELDTTKSLKGLDGGMDALFTHAFFRLPEWPVGMGEKWEVETSDTAKIGEGYTHTTEHQEYTIIQKENKNGHDCLNIGFISKTETTGRIFQMGMELILEGSGDVKGEIWFDPKSGIMLSKESTTTMDMTYALTGQVKMSIPSTQTIHKSYKLME